MKENITVEEAIKILSDYPVSPAIQTLPLELTNGRVLAEDIYAAEPLPHFDRSPYDGYAFRGEDTAGASRENPVILRITEEIPAGKEPTMEVLSGSAAKILTGAPIPPGANATIKFEYTEFTSETVTFFKPVAPNTDIVPAGEDVSQGELIAKKGAEITPPLIGILSGLGVTELPVFRRPLIAVISTGDELLRLDEPLRPAKIRGSGYYILGAYLEREGAEITPPRIAGDDAEEIKNAIQEALKSADMVITTGGVSVGDYDMVRAAADALGAESLFWKLRMKPGSAVLAASYEDKLILGLSGNPAAAVLALHMIALPFVRRLSGKSSVLPEKIRVKLLEPFKKSSPSRRFIRGRLRVENGEAYLSQTGPHGGGVISSLVGADLLGEIPEGSPPIPAGTMIDAYRIGAC